jgi:hypothetical protein
MQFPFNLVTRSLVSLSTILCLSGASAASLVVGGPATNHNAFPFGGGVGGAATRYQQAYAASDFSGAGGSILITGIDFLDGGATLAPSTYTLSFSTISAGIDSLSGVNFDANRGADNALFAKVVLSGVAPTTLMFPGVPFSYSPANGNLLLDIVVSPGGIDANSGFGAHYLSNQNAPGIFTRYQNFGSTASRPGWGLVTEFEYAVVPEPSVASLLCIALVLAGCFRSWYRR